MNTTLCATFIGQQLQDLSKPSDLTLAAIGNKRGRSIPLTHHIFIKDRGWVAKPSAPHPTILVTANPCPQDHSEFGHTITNHSALQPILSSPVCADTGCQSTAIPPSYAYKAGYRRKDFLPVASRMNGAGRSDLGVIGAKVFIQNQVGNNPRRWERTGTVVETKDHDQYNVKVDGTGRLTLRNRRFLRQFSPIPRAQPNLTTNPTTAPSGPSSSSTPAKTTDTEPCETWDHQQPPLTHTELQQHHPQQLPPTEQHEHEPVFSQEQTPPEPTVPDINPDQPTPPRSPQRTHAAPTPPTPESDEAPPPAPRPQRQRKPNSMLSAETWDLSSMEEDNSGVTGTQVMDLLRALMKEMKHYRPVLEKMHQRLAPGEEDK